MIAIINARIFTMAEKPIEKGSILIKDNKIIEISERIELTPEIEIYDAEGKTVLPGLIDAHTHLGIAAMLREALMETEDYLAEKNENKSTFKRNLKNESLLKVLDKEIPLKAHVHRADDIMTAITINPAEMMNIEDKVGSIEVGKDADLIVLNGDPLAFDTNLEKVMINGQFIN